MKNVSIKFFQQLRSFFPLFLLCQVFEEARDGPATATTATAVLGTVHVGAPLRTAGEGCRRPTEVVL